MISIRVQDDLPQVWDRWESDGATWTIEDLPPEDEEEAIRILVEHLCPDETVCIYTGILDDPLSLDALCRSWRSALRTRMSLGCYCHLGGNKELVGLNVCYVKSVDGPEDLDEVGGKSYENLCATLKYIESVVDDFKLLNTSPILAAIGLVVKEKYRGAKLGGRILHAREKLCRHVGIKATSTVFTGIASQKSAERCDFQTAIAVSLKEFADAGLPYPRDETRFIKLMYKKYVED